MGNENVTPFLFLIKFIQRVGNKLVAIAEKFKTIDLWWCDRNKFWSRIIFWVFSTIDFVLSPPRKKELNFVFFRSIFDMNEWKHMRKLCSLCCCRLFFNESGNPNNFNFSSNFNSLCAIVFELSIVISMAITATRKYSTS